jgi:hypothetical protein
MVATLLALSRSSSFKEQVNQPTQSKPHPYVLNIVVAGGEVGSGTANACGAKHFSVCTPSGKKVTSGGYLEGIFDGDIEVGLALSVHKREYLSSITAGCSNFRSESQWSCDFT